jgi:hypothetical protein
MPSLTTHLVIGERIFRQFTELKSLQPAYGEFLLGCLLVDVNGFSDIDRSVSHFDKDHHTPLVCACDNFLGKLEGLLIRPWASLENHEKAFVSGYFCHLAADEEWKNSNLKLRKSLGIENWSELMPVDVVMTEFDILSNDLYLDASTVRTALGLAHAPNVFNHIPYSAFQHMWDVAQVHVLEHSSLNTFTELMMRNGATPEEVQTVRQQHEQYREKADQMISDYFGGVKSRVETMVSYAIAKMPDFWGRFTLSG